MEWVHPEHREIHDYLIHWGRWLRSSYPQGMCRSIEHRYKSPQCWYPLEPKPEPPEERKAVLVEGCMRIVPRPSRKLLKFKYVYHADQEWIQKRLHLHADAYTEKLYTARQIVLNLVRAELFPGVHGRFHHLPLDTALVSANI